jgi:hypothetical protein
LRRWSATCRSWGSLIIYIFYYLSHFHDYHSTKTLTTLDLQCNRIGVEDAQYLKKALQSISIRVRLGYWIGNVFSSTDGVWSSNSPFYVGLWLFILEKLP